MFPRLLRGILFTLVLSVFFPLAAFASSNLFLTPASGSYPVDEPTEVRVIVESTEKISAIEANLEFDPKMLSIKIIKSSDKVSWIASPFVDEEEGKISFSGIISKDAPLSSELLALSVVGLRPGSPEIRFVSGASAVAADGTGGNTLGKVTHASFDILTDEGEASQGVDGEVLGVNDSVLSITSPDITDQSAWYALKSVILNWTLPFEVNSVLTGLTKKQEDVGYKLVNTATTTRVLSDLEDGEWYFHLTPKGKALSDTAHFRIAIDNEAPLIGTTTERERQDKRDPNIKYFIEASDKTSGISHFEMMINGGSSSRWEDDGTHEYSFRAEGIGEHDLTISAFDKANNRSETHMRFSILPLDEPRITLLRNKVPEASPIVAEILGMPNASAVVTFEGGTVRNEDTISLDNNGRASYILKESVLPGNYQIQVVQKLENGAISKGTTRVDIEVTPSIIGYIGRNLAISIALIPVILVGILYLLFRLGIISWFVRRRMRNKSIQKVAPLSLMPPRETSGRVTPVATFEIKRVQRVQNPNSVIDLRKKN